MINYPFVTSGHDSDRSSAMIQLKSHKTINNNKHYYFVYDVYLWLSIQFTSIYLGGLPPRQKLLEYRQNVKVWVYHQTSTLREFNNGTWFTYFDNLPIAAHGDFHWFSIRNSSCSRGCPKHNKQTYTRHYDNWNTLLFSQKTSIAFGQTFFGPLPPPWPAAAVAHPRGQPGYVFIFSIWG